MVDQANQGIREGYVNYVKNARAFIERNSWGMAELAEPPKDLAWS